MNPDPGPDAFRLLVESWLTGFGVSRQVPVRRSGAMTEVEVGAEGRRLELVLVEPDDALMGATMARLVGTSDVWSTVLTRGPRARDLPTGVAAVLTDEVLMVADLRADPEPRAGHLRRELVVDGDRAVVRLLAGDEVAARGQVAVVGRDAIFDRILTEEAFRRQGLGTAVMGALAGWAVTRGARRGILAASADGQGLYRTLDWEAAGAMLTVAGTGPTS